MVSKCKCKPEFNKYDAFLTEMSKEGTNHNKSSSVHTFKHLTTPGARMAAFAS
jgi:hypothetical protein